MARSYLRQAEERVTHATDALARGNYAYVIRQCQESVELALKAALRLVGIEPPKFHDVGPLLRRTANSFPDWYTAEIDRMASISRTLSREREPSMYGDEELALPPDDLYSAADAQHALRDGTFILTTCKRLFEEAERNRIGTR